MCSLTIKSFKGKKAISDHALWAMGRVEQPVTSFFVDFEEPKDSKGLRFLFQTENGKEPRAFMYLPVTGKTVPLGLDDTSVDIGGTGLSLEDLLVFVPKPGETESILREEKCRWPRLLRGRNRHCKRERTTAVVDNQGWLPHAEIPTN